jgi:hypothetical protein
LQLLTPQFRIRLGRTVQELQTELEREIGSDVARAIQWSSLLEGTERATAELWQSFPDRLTFHLREEGRHEKEKSKDRIKHEARGARSNELLSKVLETFAASPEMSKANRNFQNQNRKLLSIGLGPQDLEDLLEAFNWAATGIDTQWEKPTETLRSFSLARGASSFQGGRTALRQMLHRLAVRNGAHAPQGRTCRRIFADRGQLTGVQMSQSGNVIGATGLVLGISLDEAASLLSEENRQRSALRSSPPCRGWIFSISLTLPSSAIPPGTSTSMVWRSRNAPPLMLEVASPHDYGTDLPERKLLFIRTELPFEKKTLAPEYQRLMAARMLEQVEKILPGVSGRIQKVYPDCRIKDDDQWRDAFPFTQLHEIPESIRIFARGASGGVASGVEGIFVATRESEPGLGDFSSVLAGIEAAAWIAHRNGISGPLG